MPELPEVETVCRGLRPLLEGRVLTQVDVRRPDLRVPFPPDLSRQLTGKRVRAVRRRSKYGLIDVDGAPTVLFHLGMSGRMNCVTAADASTPGPHDHLILTTDMGMQVRLNDPRRFGLVVFAPDPDQHPLLSAVGPEPLGNSFNEAYLDRRLAGRQTSMKAALMDQKTVAGLGNIYVCEALFRAGISPRRTAATVPGLRVARLVPAIRQVLVDAIEAGGSTLRDYAHVDGELGYFQHDFRVYGREGQPCRTPGCTATVRRIVQSNRSTFYCPACQR